MPGSRPPLLLLGHGITPNRGGVVGRFDRAALSCSPITFAPGWQGLAGRSASASPAEFVMDSPLEEPDSNHRSRGTRPISQVASGWFPPTEKVGAKENRHTKRQALPPRNRWFESCSLHRRVSCKPDFLALSAPSRSRSSSSDNCACVRTSGFCHFPDLIEDGIGDPADQIRQHAHRQGAGRGARQGARSLNKV